jgi:hypothetical protein
MSADARACLHVQWRTGTFCKHSTFMCRRFQGTKFDTSSVLVSYEINCLENESVIVAWDLSFVSSHKFSWKQVCSAFSLKHFKGRWWIYAPPDLASRPHSVCVLPMLLAMRPQWLRSHRHELSSLARTLGSWVRIPLKAWMSAFILSVLFCV